MAEVFRMRCLACGMSRPAGAFGIDAEEGTFDPEAAAHESGMAIVNIGGRGRCSWDKRPLPLHLAHAMRRNLYEALRRLDAEIAEVESG